MNKSLIFLFPTKTKFVLFVKGFKGFRLILSAVFAQHDSFINLKKLILIFLNHNSDVKTLKVTPRVIERLKQRYK